ncbi:MAG TPA: M28 family peptidase [Jiangellales bacterium]|nr:M28 family peptidase [Jiangellales bacterium]
MSTTPEAPLTRPISRRRALSLAAGTAAAVTLPLPAWAADDQRPGAQRRPALTGGDRAIVARVSAERALEHIRVLSEDIGPRIGGTASERAAANYIAGVLDGHGFSTRLQEFPVADKFLGQLAGVGTSLPADLCWQVGAAANGRLDVTVTGRVIDAGPGLAASYPGDAAGAIALVDYATSNPARQAQVAAAVAAGVVALVWLPADLVEPRRAQAFSPPLAAVPGGTAIPVVGVAQAQKHRLRELLAAGPLTLQVATTAHRNLISQNVLADRPGQLGGPGSPVVMVSAHYDSVIGAPGANDDGSGTGLCLELARVLRALPTEATVAFGLWGSEEQGLIGSRYHVAQLPQAERDRLTGVFQNDMVATSWDPATRYWLLSFTGQNNVITQAVIDSAHRLGYAPRISPVTQRGASDHQSFQEVGIASANFSWRGEQSPALLEPPYHSPEDTIAKNISLERLQVSLELIGTATYATAGGPPR